MRENSNEKLNNEDNKINVEKEISYMVAIPQSEESVDDPKSILARLTKSRDIKLLSYSFDESLELKLEIEGAEYQAYVMPTDFEIPEMFRINHFFPDLDVEMISKARVGLSVEMEFCEDALASYHAQLKIIHTLVPDVLAVLDFCSEKILSGKWVFLAADSKVPPAPRYIYTVQAVSDDEGCVWLHSHGLNRCGLPEIEVLNSNKEIYQSHYYVMETLANRMLEMKEPPKLGEPILVAEVTDENALVATLIDWEEAIAHYPEDMLGGKDDRKEGHNENTCGIFVYPTYEDWQNGEYAPLAVYDDFLKDNPVYMVSDAETERMRKLARERLPYVLKVAEDSDNKILMKIGLDTDDEFQHVMEHEHIWFELIETSENAVTCKLTQEPFYVKDMHEGNIGTYPFDRITDWLIYTKERRITADDVYLYEYI